MKTSVEVEIGTSKMTIETGEMARQAGGSVLIQSGESIVFAAATSMKEPREGIDFFPLTIDYREKFYAAGKIPGGFLKREARPSDKETLICRLVDRPLRPLFPDGYANETQVLIYTYSYDGENEVDLMAITAASAALMVSNVPFNGPVSAVRVGFIDDDFVINPTASQREDSKLDLIVAGTSGSIMMVEGEAKELTEHQMVQALEIAHKEIKRLCEVQNDLASKAPKEKMSFDAPGKDTEWHEKVRSAYEAEIKSAVNIHAKHERSAAVSALKTKVLEELTTDENRGELSGLIKGAFADLQKEIVRKTILDEGLRADGRGLADVRPITIRTGLLPRTHGSALFTRGETQALVVVTLGTGQDEQMTDNIQGKSFSPYIFHYNFPPFSVGEVKFHGGPGRREIGHGTLAGRGVAFALPDHDEFPYTIRIVSEILESNGSSSMASVCGGTLALLDAGVKIKAPVAGVAMGLVMEGDKSAILTDILGLEDALGDMDFKVAGTRDGITAIQMDIKIAGISTELMEKALEQARQARTHILDEMQKALPGPKAEMSEYAPRMETINIPVDMTGALIGPGGKTIRAITESTECQIDIEDGGVVKIFSVNSANVEKARKAIEAIVTPAEIDKLYLGKVVRIVDFGAFVELAPGTDGLVHISHLADYRVNKVTDILTEGDIIWVKVVDIDQRSKKIRLSHKEAQGELTEEQQKEQKISKKS